jgi:hypothetical protein
MAAVHSAQPFRDKAPLPTADIVWRDANSDKQIKTSFLTAGLQYMSLGLLAGFKLPTGDYIYNSFDRDTSI